MPTPRGREALILGRQVFADLEREWAETIGVERVTELRKTLQEIHAHQTARSLEQLSAVRLGLRSLDESSWEAKSVKAG